MDSISHTKVAGILLGYVEEKCDITFNHKSFVFGNLKPDLKGEYLNRQSRHYPSLLFDDVISKIKAFVENHQIEPINSKELSEDLGEICHYLTDFFCFPHNDDIYNKSLFAHYIYEKRISFGIGKKIDAQKFRRWVTNVSAPFSLDALISRIKKMHNEYLKQEHHNIADDITHICQVCVLVVMSLINITFSTVVAGEHIAGIVQPKLA